MPANAEANGDAYPGTRQQLVQAVADDLLQEYLAALQETHGVTVHPELIQRHIDGL